MTEPYLKWIGNIHKDEVENYKTWGHHKDFIVGRPLASGSYSAVQLEIYNMVGLYIEVNDETETESSMHLC